MKQKELPLGLVADGIYRRKGGMLFERPWVDGKRTWRSLENKNIKLAKEELHRRRSGVKQRDESDVTTGEIIVTYRDAGCLDDQRQHRPAITLEKEERYCGNLLGFFDNILADDVTHATLDRFCDWRVKKIKQKHEGRHGTRAVDLDLNTLSNAFSWAMRIELYDSNPVADRPLYHTSSKVKHCRETMPHNATDLHKLFKVFFNRRSQSCVLGFQGPLEALTGIRTAEVIALRMDAAPYQPGWITPDGKYLYVRRVKKQGSVNPYCLITPALRAVLDAHKEWHQTHFQNSPWYLPSPKNPLKHIGSTALARALERLDDKALGYKVTSHGMRAFYVLVRRSQGANDSQIAAELGHTTGGSTVERVYGGIPANWANGGGPNMSWEPDGDPAWSDRKKNGWQFPKDEEAETQKAAA